MGVEAQAYIPHGLSYILKGYNNRHIYHRKGANIELGILPHEHRRDGEMP